MSADRADCERLDPADRERIGAALVAGRDVYAVVAALLADARADAWDEGYKARDSWAKHQDGPRSPYPNPYRAALAVSDEADR